MKKAQFLSTSILDIISWILLLLVAILFYFIFKFAAQNASITVNSYIRNDEFFPSIYLLNSPYESASMVEHLIDLQKQGNFDAINTYIAENYYYLNSKNIPYYWSLKICDQFPASSDDGCSTYYKKTSSKHYLFPLYSNPLFIQLPNKGGKELYVNFIYSPSSSATVYTPLI